MQTGDEVITPVGCGILTAIVGQKAIIEFDFSYLVEMDKDELQPKHSGNVSNIQLHSPSFKQRHGK